MCRGRETAKRGSLRALELVTPALKVCQRIPELNIQIVHNVTVAHTFSNSEQYCLTVKFSSLEFKFAGRLSPPQLHSNVGPDGADLRASIFEMVLVVKFENHRFR